MAASLLLRLHTQCQVILAAWQLSGGCGIGGERCLPAQCGLGGHLAHHDSRAGQGWYTLVFRFSFSFWTRQKCSTWSACTRFPFARPVHHCCMCCHRCLHCVSFAEPRVKGTCLSSHAGVGLRAALLEVLCLRHRRGCNGCFCVQCYSQSLKLELSGESNHCRTRLVYFPYPAEAQAGFVRQLSSHGG